MFGSRFIVLASIGVVTLSAPCFAQVVLRVRPGAQTGGDGTTWNSAFSNLSDALTAGRALNSPTGVQIWLAAGTYKPASIVGGCGSVTLAERSASFEMFSRLTILGGFPATGEPGLSERNSAQFETILSGDLCGDDPVDPLIIANRADNSLHVVTVDFAVQAVIDGVTIRGGNADAPGATRGGAINEAADFKAPHSEDG